MSILAPPPPLFYEVNPGMNAIGEWRMDGHTTFHEGWIRRRLVCTELATDATGAWLGICLVLHGVMETALRAPGVF